MYVVCCMSYVVCRRSCRCVGHLSSLPPRQWLPEGQRSVTRYILYERLYECLYECLYEKLYTDRNIHHPPIIRYVIHA